MFHIFISVKILSQDYGEKMEKIAGDFSIFSPYFPYTICLSLWDVNSKK